MLNLVRKWRELAPLFFRATATSPLFFTSAPPRRAPSFSVRASGAVALKVAQVSNTASSAACGLSVSSQFSNLDSLFFTYLKLI